MNKYNINFLEKPANHAGNKARDDIAKFLMDENFININFDRDISSIEKLIFTKENIRRKTCRLKSEDIVLIHYPIYLYSLYAKYLLNILKKRHIRIILFIHDINALRIDVTNKEIRNEISLLNRADVIISHNQSMTDWLKNHGIKKDIVNLDIFDYDNKWPIKINRKDDSIWKIVYAGNLLKAGFLQKLGINRVLVNVYGPGNLKSYPKSVVYRGQYDPTQLPKHLDGNFGLVWDGNSIDECSGKIGSYLMFNNPHKVSLYISCGLPIIIWQKAALASFIQKYNLGICINSLNVLPDQLMKLSITEYNVMATNARIFADKLRKGYYTKMAVRKACNILNENKN
jgi:hypothetical protein